MRNKEKPYLGGIHEFGVAAYIKDLKARKLDAGAQLGRFVGYDSESKRYRIYWPGKRSVTIERNVMFNENNIKTPENNTTIPGDILAEGERDKIIQQPGNSSEINKKSDIQTQPHNQPSSSIPFSTTSKPTFTTVQETEDNEQTQAYGHGLRAIKPQGAYKDMNEGLVAAVTLCNDLQNKVDSVSTQIIEDDTLYLYLISYSLILHLLVL